MDDCHRNEHHGRLAQVVQDVDNTDPPGFPVRADVADNGRGHAVPQVDADDNRIDRLEGQQSARGECLQDTNGCRGALQHKGYARAGQVTQEWIIAQT